ncbi:unnamed protein product [Arctogadus glacialis]
MCHGNGITFEHFSSGSADAVRGLGEHVNRRAARRSGRLCAGPLYLTGKTEASRYGPTRGYSTSATADLPQPRFVTLKVSGKPVHTINYGKSARRGARRAAG